MTRYRKLLIFFLLAAALVSGGLAITDYMEKSAAEAKFQALRERVAIPQREAEEEPEQEETGYQAPQGLLDLMEENPSVIGWLRIEDTNIDYPIVQDTQDNEWFLYRDVDGLESKPGSVFLDSNQDIHIGGMHAVYGHHMKNGTMFRDIYRFLEPEYMEEHQNITIWTDKREIRLKPVYCYTGKEDRDYRRKLILRKKLEGFLLDRTGIPISTGNAFVLITCSYRQRDGRCYLICIDELDFGGTGT